MQLNEYQYLAHKTSAFNNARNSYSREHVIMSILGLCGESGEVADLLKKQYFHNHSLDRSRITNEIGDVLWYIAELCTAFNLQLGEVAAANLLKLRQRYGSAFSTEASINRSE